jgi:hypothetical protein
MVIRSPTVTTVVSTSVWMEGVWAWAEVATRHSAGIHKARVEALESAGIHKARVGALQSTGIHKARVDSLVGPRPGPLRGDTLPAPTLAVPGIPGRDISGFIFTGTSASAL